MLYRPFVLLGVFGVASLPLQAEVFWRLPKRADAVLQHLGGVCVYTTDAQLNGAPGTLSAYTLGTSATETRDSLARTLGLPASASFGGTLITHAEKDRVRRLFVLPAASGESASVVLMFDQSLRDYARVSQEAPAWPDRMPAVVDAPPLFAAVCTKTRTSFAVAETPSDPQAAMRDAAQTLRRSGWLDVSSPPDSAFKLFSSGRKVCVLLASRHPQNGRTTISVLQREGAAP